MKEINVELKRHCESINIKFENDLPCAFIDNDCMDAKMRQDEVISDDEVAKNNVQVAKIEEFILGKKDSPFYFSFKFEKKLDDYFTRRINYKNKEMEKMVDNVVTKFFEDSNKELQLNVIAYFKLAYENDDYISLSKNIKAAIKKYDKSISSEKCKLLTRTLMNEFKKINISLFQDIMICIEEQDSGDTNKSRFFRDDYMKFLIEGV
jgi:hypothetical protein